MILICLAHYYANEMIITHRKGLHNQSKKNVTGSSVGRRRLFVYHFTRIYPKNDSVTFLSPFSQDAPHRCKVEDRPFEWREL